MKATAIIMAGGAGTRFWPLSTDERPKQFLSLDGHRTLLQHSYDRLLPLFDPEDVLVLTNQAYVGLVQQQLPDIPSRNVIGEPARKDTAAAVALASLLADQREPASLMCIVTADHHIETVEQFQTAMRSAFDAATEGEALYTFGLTPTYPATGFGYLELGEALGQRHGLDHYRLKRFREKPDLDLAKTFLESGRFLWNSGMFVWRSDTILGEFEAHLPAHLHHLRGAVRAFAGPDWEPKLAHGFHQLEKVSVDYAILEKAREVRAVVPRYQWDDLGGWGAIDRFLDQVESDNFTNAEATFVEAGGNRVFCENSDELVGLFGVDNLVVVRSGNRTLVVPKDRVDELKKLVQRLQ